MTPQEGQQYHQSEQPDKPAETEKKWTLEDLQNAETANGVLQAYVELSKASGVGKAELMTLAGEQLLKLGETVKAMQFIMSAEQTRNFDRFDRTVREFSQSAGFLEGGLESFANRVVAFNAGVEAMGEKILTFNSATERMEDVAAKTIRAAGYTDSSADKVLHAADVISNSADSIQSSSYRMNR